MFTDNKYRLVYDTIKDLDLTRKCWRMVGGVMVERTIGEIMPPLKAKIDAEVINSILPISLLIN